MNAGRGGCALASALTRYFGANLQWSAIGFCTITWWFSRNISVCYVEVSAVCIIIYGCAFYRFGLCFCRWGFYFDFIQTLWSKIFPQTQFFLQLQPKIYSVDNHISNLLLISIWLVKFNFEKFLIEIRFSHVFKFQNELTPGFDCYIELICASTTMYLVWVSFSNFWILPWNFDLLNVWLYFIVK